ncbi:amidohydrolase family protein [Marininema halotolerans]|uniref:5-methylthioadenosine/S-adenosylhomocysteine deaminase n=1 Tax=Marininema halotolerans TaxID=1155944 RepID=A0A1I6R9F4_9BACL|nr:amidohydrolase [Marininema halotolerans]SFS61343.1 5-methylthioadenosine/S-adenosylhomocysteine deaminase [Marininema halotolerans]
MKRLFTHTRILTMTAEEEPLEAHAMLVEDQRIAWIGPMEEAPIADEIVDLQGRLMLPGWVNTHGHAAMTLLRSFADDLPLQTWLEQYMWPIEARFGAEQVHWGTQLAVAEMIRCGTTCFTDMYDHMDEVAKVVETSGLRASLCRGVIGLGSQEERDWKRKEAVQFAKDWHGQADGRITTMMSPHAPYTCPPDYIEEIVTEATRLNLPIHIHLSETKGEVQRHVDTYGIRPVKHLEVLGVFKRPTLVAHAVHVTEEELEILLQYDVKISHNPGSNLKLGSGIAPIPLMLAKGLRPSLGTDGAASNNNLDIMEEVRLASLIHKGNTQDPEAVPAFTALKMGTCYGAEALFLDQEIGTLEVGKKADFITLDMNRPHLRPMHDLVSLLVYSASRADIQDVYVDGRALMRNQELLTIDEERILFETDRTFQAVAP